MRDFNGGGRGGGFAPRAPVKVGDELTVKIEAVGEKGDGVAKKDGFVLFVPGTHQGEEVKVRVTKVLRKLGFAEVVGKSGSSEGGEEASFEEESDNPEDSDDFGEEER